MRGCDVCGGVDEQPRHVQECPRNTPGAVPDASIIRTALSNGADDAAIAALLDPTTIMRHFSCCALQGCQVCSDSVANGA